MESAPHLFRRFLRGALWLLGPSKQQPTGTEDGASHSGIDAHQGQLEDVGAGYAFFWSGRTQAERRNAGLVFAIRTEILGRLPCLLLGINNFLMNISLYLQDD
ncbi:unnamed protein product [Schistocephalus solidus]|uniref:Secreted protein n=1 Tax=Schistocephalus solidus TaxID=70667 RepID=A0A183TQV2_SCHSO|nr:unnamed protein product [Schistocephalus solidus]